MLAGCGGFVRKKLSGGSPTERGHESSQSDVMVQKQKELPLCRRFYRNSSAYKKKLRREERRAGGVTNRLWSQVAVKTSLLQSAVAMYYLRVIAQDKNVVACGGGVPEGGRKGASDGGSGQKKSCRPETKVHTEDGQTGALWINAT